MPRLTYPEARVDGSIYYYKVRDYWHSVGCSHALDQAEKVAQWLSGTNFRIDLPDPTAILTVRGFKEWWKIMDHGRRFFEFSGIRCEANLDPRLKPYYENRQRVEIHYLDGDRERGLIGRSTGWMPSYLLLPRRNSSGGGAISRGILGVEPVRRSRGSRSRTLEQEFFNRVAPSASPVE